jgi:hypothetical protein
MDQTVEHLAHIHKSLVKTTVLKEREKQNRKITFPIFSYFKVVTLLNVEKRTFRKSISLNVDPTYVTLET